MNLKELSDYLKLSQTTVSRALGGYPEVSEATRKKVKDAAEQNGYRPNTRAKSLATGRSMAIGHVFPMGSKTEAVNPIFAEFISGASEVYAKKGYEIILSIARHEDEHQTYRELKAKKSVDGVIVHAPRNEEPRIQLLKDIALPFVVHGRDAGDNTNHSWVDVDNKRAFQRATHFLIDLGHRRISLINGMETMNFAHRRREGYLTALENHAISADDGIMKSQALTEYYGYRSAKELLSQPNPPTAFLVSSYIVAIGVRLAIQESGLTIGDDVSVVTHDDELSYFSYDEDIPQFTATRSSVKEAGLRAAEILLDLIENPNQEPKNQMLMAELVVGRSTGPAPAKRRIT